MMRMATRRFVLCVMFVVAASVGSGCGPTKKDFTPEEFETIKKDMSEDEVLAKLGKPTEVMAALGTQRYFYETQGKYYSISIKDKKVVEPMTHPTKEDYALMKALMEVGKKFEGK